MLARSPPVISPLALHPLHKSSSYLYTSCISGKFNHTSAVQLLLTSPSEKSIYINSTPTYVKTHTQPPSWGESIPPASSLRGAPPRPPAQSANNGRSKEKMHINVVVIGHVDSGKSTTTGRKPAPPSACRVTPAHNTHRLDLQVRRYRQAYYREVREGTHTFL